MLQTSKCNWQIIIEKTLQTEVPNQIHSEGTDNTKNKTDSLPLSPQPIIQLLMPGSQSVASQPVAEEIPASFLWRVLETTVNWFIKKISHITAKASVRLAQKKYCIKRLSRAGCGNSIHPTPEDRLISI